MTKPIIYLNYVEAVWILLSQSVERGFSILHRNLLEYVYLKILHYV